MRYLLLAVICCIFAAFSGALTQGWIWADAESILKAVSNKGLIPLTIYGVIGGVAIDRTIGRAICGAIGWAISGEMAGAVTGAICGAIEKIINSNFVQRGYSKSDTTPHYIYF